MNNSTLYTIGNKQIAKNTPANPQTDFSEKQQEAFSAVLMESLEPRLMLDGDITLLEADASWSNPDWLYRKSIAIDPSITNQDLTDYPLLISLTDLALVTKAQNDADDLFFTFGNETVKLDHEIESYNPATGAMVAWVKVPFLSATETTSLYMYYGNALVESQANPQAVWDINYLAVQHLEETGGTVTDSTAYANNGQPLNGVNQNVTGIIDGADAFDGINDRIVLPQVFTNQQQFTIEAWVYAGNQQGYIVSQRNTSGQGAFIQYYAPSQQIQFYANNVKLDATASANAWHYVMATYNGTQISLYIDGQLVASANATITWPNQQTIIGNNSALTRPFLGTLDEIRISNTARDASYAQTVYQNLKSPQLYTSAGTEETGNSPIITVDAPLDGAKNVSTDQNELIFSLYDPNGDLMDYTITTTPNVGSANVTGVGNGTYSLSLSELQPGTLYTWEITVTDGSNITTQAFTFETGISWHMPGWQYRREVVIDSSKVTADLTDFPILVDLEDPDFAADVNQDGDDIVFVDSQGNILAHEIEMYFGFRLRAWVKVPTVSSTQDTVIYMYYGNGDPELGNQQNPKGVWGPEYLAVHHMEEVGGTITDSTSQNNNGQAVNGVQLGTDGVIGTGNTYDGIDDRIQLGQVYTNQTQFTFEAWVYASDHHGYIITQRDANGNGAFLQYYGVSDQFQLLAAGAKCVVSAAPNMWHYVVGTLDETGLHLYVNGTQQSHAPVSQTMKWASQSTRIGYTNDYTAPRAFQGSLDEIRLSSVARSEAYILASYTNQSAPQSFLSIGSKERAGETLLLSNVYPSNNGADIEFDPILTASIKQLDGHDVDWTVEFLQGGLWVTLDTGTILGGLGQFAVPVSGVNQYETQYKWRVTLVDSQTGNMSQKIYTFTTRLEHNYGPMISNPSPADGAVGLDLNPILQANFKDIDGDPMNITFSVFNGSVWQVIATYTGVGNGTYTANTSGFISTPAKEYQWKVTATDPAGSGLLSEQVYTLRTGGTLTLKWSVTFDMVGKIEGQLQPVMGDIDGDGIQEIVLAAGNTVYAINGQTGEIKWSVVGGARDTSVELVDLDNDGIPEILYGMLGARIRALRGDGTILWTTQAMGEDQSLFPIVACDINGDGYPTIYFTTEDTTPTSYSGNPNDYTGAINMLDHNGNLLAYSWLYHPCWGGPAIADVNGDGIFEVFVSDRRAGYNGVPANGLQAFNAHTLETLWVRPDLHHSSPLPIIADVNGDGILDIIAQKIVSQGWAVLNALTGETIYDYTNVKLPVHGVGTVYDIDQDGNLDIISATGYPSNATKDFVVFDLVTGEVKFHPTFDYHAAWSPSVGDVTGDGYMEILAAMGDQGSTENFPILIYDRFFNLIDQVIVSGAGQLTKPRIFDVDGDGLSELVVCGVNGMLVVYDTHAPAPDLGNQTWTQMYSTYRQGAPVPIEAPGASAPVIENISIEDNAMEVALNPQLAVKTYDFQGDRFNLTFEVATYNGSEWVWSIIQTYSSVGNGNYTADTTGVVNEFNTQYRWRVTAEDEKGNANSATYFFTTMLPASAGAPWADLDWSYRKSITIDPSITNQDLTDYPLLISLTDLALVTKAQNDADDLFFTFGNETVKLAHEIESYNPATGTLVVWVKVPFLSATETTSLYMYYGNALVESQANPQAVWDSNYLAVQHLEETSGSATDSTGNGNNGQPLNGVNQNATGIVDGADSFDGVNDRTVLPQVFTNQQQFTIEAWVYAGNQQGYIVSQRNTSGQGMFLQYYAPSQQIQFYVNNVKLSAAASANAWHYVMATYDGTQMSLYLDGQLVASANATITWPNQQTFIGNNSSLTRPFLGTLDEIRLSNTARDAGYAQAVYQNLKSPQLYINAGEEENQTPATSEKPIIQLVSPSNGAENIDYTTLTELKFETFDLQGDLMEVIVTTSPDIGSLHLIDFAGGLVSVPMVNVQPFETYTWTVAVGDGVNWNYHIWSFTTDDPYAIIRDGDFENNVDSDQLRANSPDEQDWYFSRGSNPALAVLDETDIGGNATKKLKLLASTSTDAYITQEFRNPITENISMQWDIYVDQITNISGNPDRTGWMLIGQDLNNNGQPNESTERFVMLAFAKNGGGTTGSMSLVTRTNADTWTSFQTVTDGLQLDQWYTIRVDLDFDSRTYDVYVSGVYQGTFAYYINMNQVTHLSFAQFYDGAGTFYVDNVWVGQRLVPEIFPVSPNSGETKVPGDITELKFEISDPQGDLMDVTVTTTPDIGTLQLIQVGDGLYSVPVSGLPWNEVLEWEITATDGIHTTQRKFTFVTIADTPLVDGEFESAINSQDLLANGPIQDWYFSRGSVPSLITLNQTDIGGNATNKVKIQGSTASDAYITQEFNEPLTGQISMQWDIYVDEILDISGNPDRTGFMFMGKDLNNNGQPNESTERFAMLAFEKDGGGTTGLMNLVTRTNKDTWASFQTVATNLQIKQWYKIRVDLDLDAKTYDVFVDDVYQGTFEYYVSMSEVTHISFANLLDGAGTFYVDNVDVFPSGVGSLAVMKTMSLAGIADDPETGLLNNFLPGNESYLSSVEPGLLGSSETTSLSSVGEMAVLENSINLFEDSREGETADSFAPMISLKMPRSGKKPSGSNQLLGDRLFQGILAYSDLLKNDIRLI